MVNQCKRLGSHGAASAAENKQLSAGPAPATFNWNTTFDHLNCTDGRDKDIVLNKLNIHGPSPENLFQLTALKTLNLESNQINGSVPDPIGNLVQLRYLSLVGNQVEGKLPDVSVGQNKFTSTIPPSLGTVTSLVGFGIERQLVYGDVPFSMGSLPNLQNFFMDVICINTYTLPSTSPDSADCMTGATADPAAAYVPLHQPFPNPAYGSYSPADGPYAPTAPLSNGIPATAAATSGLRWKYEFTGVGATKSGRLWGEEGEDAPRPPTYTPARGGGGRAGWSGSGSERMAGA
ncbi:hypothetical protein DFJ73DRAFT_776903 [Zopfochytrium polystomum]|nr:hypothetical protein DFJ73DRAFT_776903 [Zopfochytrium polystomum]